MVATATTTKFVFDLQPGDVYWCTADCGWITGHSYLAYGPLLCGAATVVFEGVPNYPTPARCWQIVEKYKVSRPDMAYSSPAAACYSIASYILAKAMSASSKDMQGF
jgi:acetyl-CoA synthetase